MNFSLSARFPLALALLALVVPSAAASPASGTPPVANPDAYSTPQGKNLSVDDPGVLSNDTDADLDPLTAVLVSSAGASGVLKLFPDGSLEYEVAAGFVGTDTFTYAAHDGTSSSAPATITFTVTPGGIGSPLAFTNEAAFLTAIGNQGWTTNHESFENPLWPRTPVTASSVSNLGVTWTGNNTLSGVTTGPGPAIFGNFGFFQLPHGNYATGVNCNTPGNCTDGWIASADSGKFVAAGIWIHCNAGQAGIELILDGDTANPVDFGGVGLSAGSTGFFGVISGDGFRTWEVHETEGKAEDAAYIFADLFTFTLAPEPTVTAYGCGLNPTGSLAVLSGEPRLGTTLVLGVDNPLGTQAAGALPFLSIASQPALGFPCGLSIPGLGMAGAAGELLIRLTAPDPLQTWAGAPWAGTGTPAPFALNVPAAPALAGLHVFVQGALLDLSAGASVPLGLTDALELQLES